MYVCICVLYYCHGVATQLQLYIYIIISHHIKAKFALLFLRSDYEGCVVVQINRNKDTENELHSVYTQ